MPSREHVLVVGGGIAGLTLAAELDPRRVRVTLVEERPERAGAGTVLALWSGAMDALDAIGVGERVRAASVTATRGTLRNAAGGVLVSRATPPLTFAPRPEIVAALEAALPSGPICLTREVTDPRALAAEVGADLIVGADGVRSICRQSAFAGSAPVPTDWIALRGHLDREVTTPTEWWGPGGVFGTTPGPRGGAWFCAVRADRALQPPPRPEALALAAGHLGDWDPLLPEILAEAGGEADVQRLLLAPPLRRRTADDLVLIGDAAHGMAPNLGRGANEAIGDAHLLAQLLHRHGTKGALAPFARRRHARSQALRAASSAALRTATTTRLARVRDHALRMVRQESHLPG